EDRGERGAVDERRPEVGLHEDEEDRDERETEREERRPRLADPPRALGEEAGQREDEEQLPELGGLEAEEAEVDPALRASGGGAGDDGRPVEPAGEGLLGARRPPRPRPRVTCADVLDHQSEYTGPWPAAFTPKYCSKTRSAAGAAASPP